MSITRLGSRARDKSTAINVPRISNMARIFAHDAFLARRSAPTIARVINRSPGSPSLPSLIPTPKRGIPRIPGASHIYIHTYTTATFPVFPDLRGGDLRARRCPAAKIPGGDFLGSLARSRVSLPQRARLRWVCFFPFPVLSPARDFLSIAKCFPLFPLPLRPKQRREIETDRENSSSML